MGKTIRVTTTPAHILRSAIELSKLPGTRPDPREDTFDRQARTIDELGYAIVPKAGDVLGPVAVVLPEPDRYYPDDGKPGALPCWELETVELLSATVQAWPEGVDFDGELVTDEHLAAVEKDALRVLAAIATHRRSAGRAVGEGGGGRG